MTTLGIDSSISPAKLILEDLRIGRFCGVKELTFWFSVGSWNEPILHPHQRRNAKCFIRVIRVIRVAFKLRSANQQSKTVS